MDQFKYLWRPTKTPSWTCEITCVPVTMGHMLGREETGFLTEEAAREWGKLWSEEFDCGFHVYSE